MNIQFYFDYENIRVHLPNSFSMLSSIHVYLQSQSHLELIPLFSDDKDDRVDE